MLGLFVRFYTTLIASDIIVVRWPTFSSFSIGDVIGALEVHNLRTKDYYKSAKFQIKKTGFYSRITLTYTWFLPAGTGRQTDRRTDRQRDRPIDRQTDGRRDGWTAGQTDQQTDRHRWTLLYACCMHMHWGIIILYALMHTTTHYVPSEILTGSIKQFL